MYRLAAVAATGQDTSPYAVERVWGDVTISNGLGFSPDGSHAYYNDTPTRATSVLDYVDGALRNRRDFASLADEDERSGSPDGLCVDAEAAVGGALWWLDGAALHPQGRLDEVIELPVSQVTPAPSVAPACASC